MYEQSQGLHIMLAFAALLLTGSFPIFLHWWQPQCGQNHWQANSNCYK